jgi:tetratricopeptide (TPR) repeat protein
MNQVVRTITFTVVALCMVLMGNAQVTLQSAGQKKRNEQFGKAAADYQALIGFANGAMARQEPGAALTLSTAYYELGDNYMEWALTEMDNIAFMNEKVDSANIYFEKGIRIMDVNPLNHIGAGRVKGLKKDHAGMDAKLNYATEKIAEGKKNKQMKDMLQDAMLELAAVYSAYGTKEDLPKALVQLQEVEKKNPKNRDLYVVWGDYEEAARQFASGIEASNLSKAIGFYNRAIQVEPLNVVPVLRKGMIYKKVENWDQALGFYNEAIKLDTTFAPAYREKAELLKLAKKYDKAIEVYKKYLDLNKSCSVQQRYATFFYLANDFSRALIELESALPCNPNNFIMYRVIAYSCLKTGDYAKGMENLEIYFNKVADKSYVTGDDYALKGKLLCGLGQDSLGIEMMVKAIEMDTNYKAGYGDIIDAYKKLKKFDQAAKWQEKKIKKLGVTNKEIFDLGFLYYQSKQNVKADSIFASLESLYIDAVFYRAKVQNRMENSTDFKGLGKPYYEAFILRVANQADSSYKELYKKQLAEAYDYLGAFYYRIQDDPCAKAAWKMALEMDPKHKRANEKLVEEVMVKTDDTLCTLIPSLNPAPTEQPQDAPIENK